MNEDRSIHPTHDAAEVPQPLRALAFVVNAIRPEWDQPGVAAACVKAMQTHTLAEVTVAAVRAAETPTVRTPAVIPLPGDHWRSPAAERTPTPTKYQHPPVPGPLSEETLALRKRTRELLGTIRRATHHVASPPGAVG